MIKNKIEIKNKILELKSNDKIVRNGKIIECVPEIKRDFKLFIGDVVDRQLRDGDITTLIIKTLSVASVSISLHQS